MKGRFLLPGLIDAHAHIESPAAALRALQSGVTTARVLGDNFLQAIYTRDLVRQGNVPGPEMLVSPGHIRPKPGIAFFMVYPEFGDAIDGELRGPDRIAAATRALIAKGADVIKVGASERAGLANTDPRRPELTEAEIHAAVIEAAKKGLFVAAHAHAREGCANAVRAGVRSIEHGTWVDDETLAEMKRRGTFFVPTLAAMSPLARSAGQLRRRRGAAAAHAGDDGAAASGGAQGARDGRHDRRLDRRQLRRRRHRRPARRARHRAAARIRRLDAARVDHRRDAERRARDRHRVAHRHDSRRASRRTSSPTTATRSRTDARCSSRGSS